MSKFKVGDRVKVIKSSFMKDKTVGSTGTIVAIDKLDVILVKLDKDIGSYRHCCFNNYTSDKSDLFNAVDEEIEHLNTNKIKWLYLALSIANAIACVLSVVFSGNVLLFFANLIFSLIFLYKYHEQSKSNKKEQVSDVGR